MSDDSVTPAAAPRPTRVRRGRRLAFLLVVIVALVGAIGWAATVRGDPGPPPLPDRIDPLIPDLAMGPIADIAVGTTESGNARLRFGATIVNVGEGPFLVHADRAWPWSGDWDVRQAIEERGGGHTERAASAELVFGGDGHDHWHVRHVQAHQLETLDGEIVGRLVKQGFCFFDTDPYRDVAGSPPNPTYSSTGCGGQFETRVRMGLSVGWSDDYPWHLLDERIDVTEVPDGEYILRQIADPNDVFEELDETNNETWARIELLTTASGLRDVRVLEEGPRP